jgi:hypothetical protein
MTNEYHSDVDLSEVREGADGEKAGAASAGADEDPEEDGADSAEGTGAESETDCEGTTSVPVAGCSVKNSSGSGGLGKNGDCGTVSQWGKSRVKR